MRTFQLVWDDQNTDPENGVLGFSFRGRSLRVGDAHREAMKSFWESLLDGPVDAQSVLTEVAEHGLPVLAYARFLLRALSAAGWLRQECTGVTEEGELEHHGGWRCAVRRSDSIQAGFRTSIPDCKGVLELGIAGSRSWTGIGCRD